MSVNQAVAEDLLRGLIRAGARDLLQCVMPGIPGTALMEFFFENVGFAFCRGTWEWLSRKNMPQRQQAIDALAQMQFDTARKIAEAELNEFHFTPEIKARLRLYLSMVPMTVRRAINRYNDNNIPTTLLSQVPLSQGDVIRFMPLRPPRFEPGHQVPYHDYRLELLLGQGGFAEVWKAYNTVRTGQFPVALKFCFDPKLVESLRREISLLDRLQGYGHPEDFVKLYDTAYTADPPFLVYEYVDGSDLVGWLASFGANRPPVSDVIKVLSMTARAVAFAHRQRIVHRDLKPTNLLVTRQGRIKVCDFGIGAVIAGAEAHSGSGKGVTSAAMRSVLSGA